ncbi:MAG TPA: hypothetical protein VGG71_10085 [Chitinophagaceae bacterium]|jgi:hypothetical protein
MSLDKKYRLVYVNDNTPWLGDYREYKLQLFLNNDQPFNTHAEAMHALEAISQVGTFTIIEEYRYKKPTH